MGQRPFGYKVVKEKVYFSTRVKNEAARVMKEKWCCQRAELLGLLSVNTAGEHGSPGLFFTTENAAAARKVFSLFKKGSPLKPEVKVKKGSRFRRANTYLVRLSPQPGLDGFLRELGLGEGSLPLSQIIAQGCCRRAYLRGAFLAGGSISNPARGYHLEIVAPNRETAADLVAVMAHYDLRAKVIERKGKLVVYLKEAEQIVGFLNVIGAHRALLKLENIRVYKDVRNNINRLVNCETANLDKTVEASLRQVKKIRYLQDTLGLSALPVGLREVARARLQHPHMSLRELGQQLTPKLGKSGVNHRLRRLEVLADGLRDENGE
ncbi:MAG: DNA-binding protein WhiA [Firmicutes bacterium]|nr:DNA-binding protein WhiA [Bacillota bacterium]